MKVIFIFLFISLSLISYAQKSVVDMPEDLVEPNPYQETYFNDITNYNKQNVKELIIIIKYSYNNFKSDTLNKNYYNKNGDLVKQIRYSGNIPTSTIIDKYYADNNLKSWQIFNKNSSTLTVYKYYNNGQIENISQFSIRMRGGKNDTSEISSLTYKYADNHLVEINFSNTYNEIYKYDGDVLLFKIGKYISKEFIYDNNGNLAKQNDYIGTDIVPTKLTGIKIYNYDNLNRLIKDSILTSANFKSNNYQITDYGYNDQGQLKTMNVSYDTSYRNIEFEYINNQIQKVNLTTNQPNGSYLRFWINSRIPEYYSFPINYNETFEYDQFGNRISKKTFVNGELFSDIEYKIIYRK